MKRVAIYVRESPSLAENEATVKSQIQALTEKVKENPELILVDIYADNGYAGDLLARPDLDKLRDDAMQHKFDIVLIFDRDRLARKYWLQELVIEELEGIGIEVNFLLEKHAETDEDKIMQGVRGLFAEYERAKIRERTRRGRLHRANQGLLVGHEAPYGYRYTRPNPKKEERFYEIYEEEAKIVRMIFEWVGNEKCSLTEVRRRLYKLEIKAAKSGSTVWQNSTLSRLLRRTDYIGTAYYNKTQSIIPNKSRNNGYKRMKKTGRKNKAHEEWLPVQIPAILEKDLFDRVQEQLKQNLFFNKRNQKTPYLLSGLLFCGCGCSARLSGGVKHRKTKTYRFYRSTDRVRRFPFKPICTQPSVRAEIIEDLVWKHFSRLLENPDIVVQQLQDIQTRKAEEQKRLSESLSHIKKSLETLTKEEDNLLFAFRKGSISINQLDKQMKDIKTQQAKLEEEQNILITQPSSIDESHDITPAMIERYCDLARKNLHDLDPVGKQELLRMFIDKIIVKGRQILIQGVIPVNQPLKDASEGLVSSDSGSGCSTDRGRGGYIVQFPSSLQYSWPWRQGC